MVETSRERPGEEDSTSGLQATHYLLAFAIGALVGIGIAATWIPEKTRRRLPALLRDRYRKLRDVGTTRLDDWRDSGRALVGEFREELGSSLEAAREELGDMAGQQLKQMRTALRREARKLRR
ncbi:MAG: hypothetical protein JSU87_03930 [Gemmatimonadota bacterium]|nr:MAG: hypothetical protein JSU87_03930 [Gemmatimonadota bacterium]